MLSDGQSSTYHVTALHSGHLRQRRWTNVPFFKFECDSVSVLSADASHCFHSDAVSSAFSTDPWGGVHLCLPPCWHDFTSVFALVSTQSHTHAQRTDRVSFQSLSPGFASITCGTYFHYRSFSCSSSYLFNSWTEVWAEWLIKLWKTKNIRARC